ncbi:MAG: DUF3341 domain-containing protein [Planctomycetes bacterium]|nr:DUF3341 domain-containing protein [Planctomycetota bacterium]
MNFPPIYGLLAEFDTSASLLKAARQARAEGYRTMDAFSPMPVEGLSEALGFRHTRLPWIVLAGGLFGAAGGFFLQWYLSVIGYPLNVGGRPYNSWPAFIVVSFELAILAAAFAAVLSMLACNGLPQPYHPLFNVPRFESASRDRFFLCIEAADPSFDPDKTRRFLESLKPHEIFEVPH